MPIIKVENIAKKFGNDIILNDISVNIAEGEIISVIGPSPFANSTFLRTLNLLDKPDSGNIIINEQDLLNSKTDISKIRQKIGMIFKDFNLYSHLTVVENIMLAPINLLKMKKQQAFDEAVQLLQNFGLASKIYAFPHDLSDLEKQRVAIARTLAMKPEIILFDEPIIKSNATNTDEIIDIVKMIAKNARVIIIVTANIEFARAVSSRILYIDEACIYEEGSAREIFEHPKREKTKAFIEEINSVSRSFSPANVDISRLNEEIADFCSENFVNKQKIFNVQLIIEEIIWNILFPAFEDKNRELKFDFSINHKRELIEMIFTYEGTPYDNCLNENTIIPQKLIERKAQSIDPYLENGLNKLVVKVNTNEFVVPV